MSKLHTNNHGEVDSILDAANYSYFLKGQSFLGKFARSVSSKVFIIFCSFFFVFISSKRRDLLLLYSGSLRNRE